jgi:hypothetical protein
MTDSPAIAARRPCFAWRLCAEVKRLAAILVLLALVGVAGKYYCFDRLNEEIRSRVEQSLRNHYQGLNVSVRSARHLRGQGVEIRGVRIAEADVKNAPFIAEIDEIIARCDTRLPNFLTTVPEITGLQIRRLKLRAERKPSGRWNISHLLPLPPCQTKAGCGATITDATIEIIDGSQFAEAGKSGLMLRNIEINVEPQAAGSTAGGLKVHGTLGGDHFEQVEIDGVLDPSSGSFDVRGAVEGLEFSPRLRAALPRELAEALRPLSSVRGRTYFGFHASRSAAQAPQGPAPTIQFVVHGKIAEGRIDDARLPESLTDVEAAIRCDNHGILIDELTARCGPTQIGMRAALTGWSAAQPIDIWLTAQGLDIARLPPRVLPPGIRQYWAQFQPRGKADVAGRLVFDGTQWRPDLEIDCHDVSLCYERFPYRLTDGSGVILIKPDWLSVRLQLAGGGRPIVCQADIQQPGPLFHGTVEVYSEGPIAIDEKLLLAMDAPMQRIVRAFRPRGQASFVARIERAASQAPIQRQLEIRLEDCSIEHERFAYPIDLVTGRLRLENNAWHFLDLAGRNDSAVITGHGAWTPGGPAGGQLALDFQARDVPLAEELKRALAPATQRLWAQLAPRGNLDDLGVSLRYESARKAWSVAVRGEKRPVLAASDGQTISLRPVWFPYDLAQVTGGFSYRDGRMELVNVRAEHGRAKISAAADCQLFPGGGCRVQLTKFAADNVEADAELLAALPAGLARSLGAVPLEGPLNVLGGLTVVAPGEADAAPQLVWDFQIDVENGRLLTPTLIEHIHGGIHLAGRQEGRAVFAYGELDVDSVIVRGMQLTALQGPFWLDGRRLVFGALADRGGRAKGPQQVTARMLGGLLSLDGELALAEGGQFDVQASLANADLGEAARQLAPTHQQLSGKAFGQVHLTGSPLHKHTWRGGGQVSLREADLYELPAMITLLKLLSVQRPNTTAFTNCNVMLRVEGDDLAFDRIDFSGDAISLKGQGRLTSQRQLDLKFYPLVGREERQLPFLRPLLGQTGQEFMLIEVTGPLDQPDIRRTPFPRLDAQLAQLFPELAREESMETNMPPARPTRAAIDWLRTPIRR